MCDVSEEELVEYERWLVAARLRSPVTDRGGSSPERHRGTLPVAPRPETAET